jgi:hypothetical protein
MACVRKAKDADLANAVKREHKPGGITLLSTPYLLRANKSTDYRELVLRLSLSMAEALDALRLTKVSLTKRFAVNEEQFHITDLDLNDSGREFAKVAFRSWLAKTDRWKPESKTVEKLKASLIAEHEKFKEAHGDR